jgi:hypothetical protein
LIAQHARVRRATNLVFVGEVLDDLALKLRRLVNQIIRDAEFVADGAGVGDGLRAAAFVLGAVHAILRPELERDADDLITLLQQQRRRGGGVHSAAHADDDALTLLRIHSRTLYNFSVRCKMVCALWKIKKRRIKKTYSRSVNGINLIRWVVPLSDTGIRNRRRAKAEFRATVVIFIHRSFFANNPSISRLVD